MSSTFRRLSVGLFMYPFVCLCRLPCSFLALALLGSYAVQSDLGDHSALEHGSTGYEYIQDIKFAHRQGGELLEKIAELHKTHRLLLQILLQQQLLLRGLMSSGMQTLGGPGSNPVSRHYSTG